MERDGWERNECKRGRGEENEIRTRMIGMTLGKDSDSCIRRNLESMLQETKNIRRGGGSGEKTEGYERRQRKLR